MATTRFIFGIICSIALIGHRLPDGDLLKNQKSNAAALTRNAEVASVSLEQEIYSPAWITSNSKEASHKSRYVTRKFGHVTRNAEQLTRHKILEIARTQLHVRETGKNNYGPEIKAYLAYTKLPEGNPYCAAFVSWTYWKAGFSAPRTAWSPALFPLARQTLAPKPADVLGIYSVALKRIAHAGIVERRQNDWIISLEGNTNADGSREGDGVYRKWRHVRTIAKFANWVQ